MKRDIIISLCILTGVLSGIIFAVDTPRVRQSLLTKIQEEVQEATGYPISIGDLRISLFAPGIEIEDVTAFRPNERGPWVTIHRAKISIQPQWTPGAGLLSTNLEIDGLKGDILESDVQAFQQGTGQTHDTDTETESDSASSSPPSIDEIWIVNTTFRYTTPDFTIAAQNLELRATPRNWEGHNATIHIPSLRFTDAQQSISLEAKGQARIMGELFSPDSINIDALKIFLPGLQLEPTGEFVLSENINLQVKIGGSAILDRLREKIPSLPELEGIVRVDGSIQGELDDLKFNLILNGQDVSVLDYYLGNLVAQASFDNEKLTIEELKINRKDLGIIRVDGDMLFKPSLPMDLNLTLEGVGMGSLIEILGQPSAWVDGDINGTLGVKGTANPFDADLLSDLSVRRFKSLLGPYHNPKSEVSILLPDGKIRGRAHTTADKIELQGLVLSQGRSALTTNGTLHYDANQGMELRAVSQTFNLAEISPIAGLPYRGRGPLTATVEGPYDDLVISGTTEFKGFGIDNFQLGQTQATIIFADNALQLPRIDIQRQPGTIQGTARLEFNDVPTFDGAFEVKRVLAAPLLNSVQAIPEHAHRFEGSVDGHITISGELAQPKVLAQVKSDTLFIDEANFGETHVNITMMPEDPWLTIESRHQPEDGSLEVQMALNNASPTQFNFQADQIEMELITPFLGELEATGSVSGKGKFSGELNELNGDATLQIKGFSVYGFSLGQTDLEFGAQKGQSKVSGSCVAGAANVSANITLGEKMPYTATMQLNDVNISQIRTLPENVDLWLTGSLFSQGDPLNPQAIIADSVFDEARLVWNDIEFNQVRSVRMNYANEVLEFSDAAFAIPELTIRLAGRMPLNDDLSLRLNLNGDLSMVPRLSNEVEAGQGSVNASVLMEGTFEAPIYAGHAAIESGSMRLVSIQQEVEDIQARLDISGRTIQISEASARIGNGTVRMSGGVILVQDAPSQTNLQATFSSVRLRPDEDLDLTASGTLNLMGRVGSLELLGDVELLNLHYTSNIELDDMLRRKAKPLPLPGLSPGEAWNLRINVRGENNLLFTNNFVESELSANLRITGTTQHMGLVGTVTPIWGRATYAGNTYKVERGIIDFVEEYSISPRFEVRASTESSTEACNMQLAVNITGDDSGYTVQAEGQDDSGAPVTSQQALVCAQFGLRLDNDNNSQSNNNASGGSIMTEENATGVLSGAVDAIWKVTGMDERVRRILPVVDQFTLTSGYSKTSKKTEPRILVTKDLGKNWELKYNGPLYEKDEQHIIALQYRLSSRITLESTWVSFSEAIPSLGDMGLDLRLDWQFE